MLKLWIVVGVAAIEYVCLVTQDTESMRESGWAVKLTETNVVEYESFRLPESRRALPEVNDDVENAAVCTAHQLRHTRFRRLVPGLKVHAADDSALRAGVVVLDELTRDSSFTLNCPPEAFVDETAVVATNARLKDKGSLD